MARRRYVLWIEDSDREALEILAQRNERSLAAEVRHAMRTRIVQASRSLDDERPVAAGAVEAPTVEGRRAREPA